MNSVMLFGIIALAILALVIVCTELYDRRGSGGEIVNCPGVVSRVRKRSIIEVRSNVLWDIGIEFDYNGQRYSIELHTWKKPKEMVGDTINVAVNTKDPWNSTAILS